MWPVSRARVHDSLAFEWHEVTGAVGDSATVLPVVVAVAVLTDLSLAVMLLWFGAFQVVWGLYYGIPVSVEPMKALAALVLAGAITTGELLLAGLLLAGLLFAFGATGTISRLGASIGEPAVRGVQFGVALVLLETGLRLGVGDVWLAGLAAAVALGTIAAGYWNLSAIAVLVIGGLVAAVDAGSLTPAMPPLEAVVPSVTVAVTPQVAEATLGQLALTVGNAALAASLLVGDYFDRDVSPDDLSLSMGLMNLVALPMGAFPMCHGSGGIAGKYAFGARTATANIVLGVGYVLLALLAVGVVAAYPLAVLGVVLALIALQLGRTGLGKTDAPATVLAVGVLALVANLGVAFVAGVVLHHVRQRWHRPPRGTPTA